MFQSAPVELQLEFSTALETTRWNLGKERCDILRTDTKSGGISMRFQAICKLAVAGAMAVTIMTAPVRMAAQGGDTVLKPADTQKLLPSSVYYKAQSAPTQLRNSGGIKFSDGYYLLSTLVDTSGYSSDIAAKYQAYFITEVPIKVGGQNLPAGVLRHRFRR